MNLLSETKTAAQQAHELGLTHAGWGYWQDSSGKVVAKTINGQLVKLEPGEQQSSTLNHQVLAKTALAAKDIPDEYANKLSADGLAALESLAKSAYEHMGAAPNAQMMAQMETVICDTITADAIAYSDTSLADFFNIFDQEEQQALVEYLENLLNAKNSKLKSAVKIKANQEKALGDLIKKLEEPKPNPKIKTLYDPNEWDGPQGVEMDVNPADVEYPDPPTPKYNSILDIPNPEPEWDTPEPVDAQSDDDVEPGSIDAKHVMQLLGITPNTEGYKDFVKYMDDLDKAETGPAVNYVSQKLKKAGLINQDQWKKLHKYVKSVKDIKQGPKVPGKIKLKLAHKPEDEKTAHLLKLWFDNMNAPFHWEGVPKYTQDYWTMRLLAAKAGGKADAEILNQSLADYGIPDAEINKLFKMVGLTKKVKLPKPAPAPETPKQVIPTGKAKVKPLSPPTPTTDTADGADLENGEESPFPEPTGVSSSEWNKVDDTTKAWVNKALELSAKQTKFNLKGQTYFLYTALASACAKYLKTDNHAEITQIEQLIGKLSEGTNPPLTAEFAASVINSVRKIREVGQKDSTQIITDMKAKYEDPATWDEKTMDDVTLALSHLQSEYFETTGEDMELKDSNLHAFQNIIKQAIEEDDDIAAYNKLKTLWNLWSGDETMLTHLDKIVTKIRLKNGKDKIAPDLKAKKVPEPTKPIVTDSGNKINWDDPSTMWHPKTSYPSMVVSQKLVGTAAAAAGINLDGLSPQLQQIILGTADEAVAMDLVKGAEHINKKLNIFGIPSGLKDKMVEYLASAKKTYDGDFAQPFEMDDHEMDFIMNGALDQQGVTLKDLPFEEVLELKNSAKFAFLHGNAKHLEGKLKDMGLNPVAAKQILAKMKESADKFTASQATPPAPVAPTPTSKPKNTPAEIQSAVGQFVTNKAANAAATILNPEKWTKGDPDAALKWIKGKFDKALAVNDGSQAKAFQAIALALVKNHNVDISSLPPELVPDELKHLVGASSSKKPEVSTSSIETAAHNWVMAAPEEKPAVVKNLYAMLQNGNIEPPDPDVLSSLLAVGDIDQTISSLLMSTNLEDNLPYLKTVLAMKFGDISTPSGAFGTADIAPNDGEYTDDASIMNHIKNWIKAGSFAKPTVLGYVKKALDAAGVTPATMADEWMKKSGHKTVDAGITAIMNSVEQNGKAQGVQLRILKALINKKLGIIETPPKETTPYNPETGEDFPKQAAPQMPEVPPSEPEEPAKSTIEIQTTIDKSDPKGYAINMLSDKGIDFNTLDAPKKNAVVKAVESAFESQTEAGVAIALDSLKDILSKDAIEEMKYDIISKSTLDTDPDAFKKHFDYSDQLTKFLQSNPEFTKGISKDDVTTMLDAMKVGLQMKDDPGTHNGYAKAKEYYQNNLVGKIPGFDENMFTKWRHALKDYHDELKKSTEYVHQKKAEAEKKKAEETAQKEAFAKMQKALDALGKGDVKSNIQTIMGAIGAQNKPSNVQHKIMTQIAQALTSDTTQGMVDALDKLRNFNAYSGGQHTYSYDSELDGPAFDTLRKLVSVAWADMKHPPEVKTEPQTSQSPEIRAQHVFKNWYDNYGMTIGHVPATHHQERQKLVKAVVAAISEPDPKKVNSHLYSLLVSGTSLDDAQIEQLRKLVYQERQTPAGLQGKPSPVKAVPQHSLTHTGPATKAQKVEGPKSPLMKDAKYKKAMAYYGVDTSNQLLSKYIDSVLGSHVVAFNKAKVAQQMVATLTANYGIPPQKAKNLANWATREAVEKSPLHQAAVQLKLQAPPVPQAAAGAGDITDPIKAKEKLVNLPASLDPHGIFKGEWVKGEQVRVSQNKILWSRPTTPSDWEGSSAKSQEAWRKSHLSPELRDQYNHAGNSWQGSGQWAKEPNHRKAMCATFRKAIEGPPPMTMAMGGICERGMNMMVNDFKEYIKAFEIGKPTYIGPSGFSANRGTATGFGGMNSSANSHDRVKVMLRVLPPKNGAPVKAGCLRYRNGDSSSFSNEQEIVFGTNRNTVCTNVVKHLVESHGQYYPVYEIELQYDDSIKESITEGISDDQAFDVRYWKGLSRDTVKMLIKYNNTSVLHTPQD
jgi:hypothetical protein